MEIPTQDNTTNVSVAEEPLKDVTVTDPVVNEDTPENAVVEDTNLRKPTSDVDMYTKLRAIADGDGFLSMTGETVDRSTSAPTTNRSEITELPAVDEPIIATDEEFQTVLSSRDKFNNLIKSITRNSRETAILAGANTAKTVASATLKGAKLAETFYQLNPDLVPHRDKVKEVAAVLSALRPEYNNNIPALLVAAAAGTRQYLAANSGTVVGALDTKSTDKSTGPVAPPVRKGTPRPVTQVDAQLNKNDALFDKLFGPPKGKRN